MDAESVGSELYRQFDVLVCTGELLFSGSVRCDFSQRLIDALNEGVKEEPTFKAAPRLYPACTYRKTT
jgi:hypothetical protein